MLESPQHSPMCLILLPCFIFQRALIKCFLYSPFVLFIVDLSLLALSSNGAKVFIWLFPRMVLSTEEGLNEYWQDE